MNRAEPCAVRSPLRGWPSLVCVLGVLVGLLAMHGLAPGGLHAVGHERADGTTSAAAAAAAGAPATDTPVTGAPITGAPVTAMSPAGVESRADGTAALDGCSEDGHCGGHARHADATCAAAKVGGAPALAGPLPDPVAVVVPDEVLRCDGRAATRAARAPPSLAELQLLRI
ncbi:DUF6153 family protein [Streptomyces sp. NPDC004539]|uniref:DUF6153 family protein n=1 Tax=Streptomyces sp. NPDC004539 TaxID=3154280 RepID=UPI0033AC92D9